MYVAKLGPVKFPPIGDCDSFEALIKWCGLGIGSLVLKNGIATGVTQGRVTAIGQRLIRVEPAHQGRFALPGDSGALCILSTPLGNFAIGFVNAGRIAGIKDVIVTPFFRLTEVSSMLN